MEAGVPLKRQDLGQKVIEADLIVITTPDDRIQEMAGFVQKI